MSDEGESPPLSPSPLPSEDDKSLTPQDSPPRSRSPHSRSRSAGNNIARSRSHTPRSRTRSRSRHRSLSKSYSRHSRGESGGHRNVRYYSRSRSRTPRKKRYSRSRSKSYSPHRSDYGGYRSSHGGGGGGGGGRSYYEYSEKRSRGGDYYQRSHSRSPMSSRRRHVGNRENPPQSRCLGIFGLSLYTQERDLREVFGKYGAVEEIRVVCDAQTGRSRGFAFIYFETTEDAKVAKDRCTGLEIDGRRIRVDFSITHRAHTPTPGIYMGKPTYSGKSSRGEKGYYGSSGGGGGGGGGSGGGGYRRSPSPYYSRGHRYSRSRSRSYSPRKYDYAY